MHNLSYNISTHLKLLGLREGSLVLVHSSLKSLSHVSIHPRLIVQALRKAVGRSGTILMPALSYQHVTPEHPYFSEEHTPGHVGALPEYFRKQPGTIRSIHPTHSVCGSGPLAEALLSRHHLDHTPAGPNSPFSLLPKYGGKILFMGCGLRPNTSMHAIEEVVGPEYLFDGLVDYTIRTKQSEYALRMQRYKFRGYDQRYERVADLLEGNELKTGRLLTAQVHVMESAALWRKALPVLQRDHFYFMDRLSQPAPAKMMAI